jgi:hypothetical protein
MVNGCRITIWKQPLANDAHPPSRFHTKNDIAHTYSIFQHVNKVDEMCINVEAPQELGI